MFSWKKAENWNLILPYAEFAYNNHVNGSTSNNLFEIVHSLSPRQPIDFLFLLTDYHPSDLPKFLLNVSNAYLIDLSSNISISPIFNVADLFPYRRIFELPVLLSSIFAGTFSNAVSCTHFIALELSDEFPDVLDDEFVNSHSSGYRHFLIRWKDRPSTDDAWITEEEFHCLLKGYLHFTSSKTSSFQGGMMEIIIRN